MLKYLQTQPIALSMVNNAKMSDSSMPDFLLYKLTTESDTELNEPSESLMDKSVFQLLFDDESKIIRKHLLDISNFKLQLISLNQGLVSESEIDKLDLDLKCLGLISTSSTGAVAMTNGPKIFN